MLVNKLKAGGHRRHVGKLYAHGNGNSPWTELILNDFAWLYLLTEPWRIGAQRPRSGSGNGFHLSVRGKTTMDGRWKAQAMDPTFSSLAIRAWASAG